MTWEIFLGIVAIVSFLITLFTPLLKLTKAIAELNINMKNLGGAMTSLTTSNTESHKRIWEHNEEQDEKIENHELRITTIETKMEIMHPESK